MGAPLLGSTRQYSSLGMQSSSSRPVSKKREPSKAISLRLDTSLVPGLGPSTYKRLLGDLLVAVALVRVEGEKAEQLLLCSSDAAAQRARIIVDLLVVIV